MSYTYWLFVALLLALTTFVSYGTFATARLLQHWQPDRNLLLLPAENLLRLGIILFCFGLGWLSGLNKSQLGWQLPLSFQPLFQQLSGGIVIGLGTGAFFYYSTQWLIAHTGHRFYSSTIIEYIIPTNLTELGLVLLALVPAVFLEEILFRSLLLAGLAPILPIPFLLVGLGILFGLLHSPQGLWGMVGAGLAGILFAILFLWQGSLLLPVVTHYVVNAFQIIIGMATLKKV